MAILSQNLIISALIKGAIFALMLGCAEPIAAPEGTGFMATTISPTDAGLTYIGRWQSMTIGGAPSMVAINEGLRVRFHFTGTSLTIKLGVISETYKPDFEYSIDGGAYTRDTADTASIALATGLPDTTHTAEIWVAAVYVDNPRWDTFTGFWLQGFELDDGKSVSSWETNLPKMLVIGDSIGEGELVLGSSIVPASDSGRQSLSNQLGDLLGYEVWVVAFGGAGFTVLYDASNVPYLQNAYPYKMDGYAEADPSFDIVLIEAINNDLETDANLQTNYESLLTQIIADHPSARIYCMGRLGGGPSDSAKVQSAAATKGATYISPVGWTYTYPNLGHPDLAGHTAIAAYLYDEIYPDITTTTTTGAPTTTTTVAPTYPALNLYHIDGTAATVYKIDVL